MEDVHARTQAARKPTGADHAAAREETSGERIERVGVRRQPETTEVGVLVLVAQRNARRSFCRTPADEGA